jgi:mannose-6-phosphate isomerase-like protein (cupin superfamily)
VNAATLAQMNSDEKETFHRAAEARVQTFTYQSKASDQPKDIIPLVHTENLRIMVQVVHDGGENNLHYHINADTTWMVLRGGVRFYGPGDVVIAELGPEQGIMIPGGARYWFEKTGQGDLEIIQMIGNDRAQGKSQRINIEAHKDWMTDDNLRIYEGSVTS